MFNNFTIFFRLLKLGAFLDLYFLANTIALSSDSMDVHIVIPAQILFGLVYLPWQSIHVRNRTSDAAAWGGLVGLTWMASYWATLIPMWVNHVVGVFSAG